MHVSNTFTHCHLSYGPDLQIGNSETYRINVDLQTSLGATCPGQEGTEYPLEAPFKEWVLGR